MCLQAMICREHVDAKVVDILVEICVSTIYFGDAGVDPDGYHFASFVHLLDEVGGAVEYLHVTPKTLMLRHRFDIRSLLIMIVILQVNGRQNLARLLFFR